MARVFPQAAISSPYMSTERETFTVWMKSLVYQTNGLTVYNSNGEITYRVENYDKSSNEVHIMDLNGNILFTIRKKKLWLFGSWYVYRECGSFSSTKEVKPFVRIKRSSIRDGDWEVRDETNEVFWILRFDPKFVFQMIDIHGDIIAQLSESRGEAGRHKRQQHFEHELKNMISSLTHMGGEKAGTSQYEEDEDGIRVITLSGSNLGATMKTELDNNHGDIHKNGDQELDFLSTFVNSNFQAVNNSIMIGANYETHDPGVHLDISGDVEKPSMKAPARGSRGKKGKTHARSDRRESEQTK